ncbi:hypothetical protein F8388_025690 [Cannabis sativa]|uniref:Uncharacterized protein n=1 Tax=Cannabis sativa TaxID=3483 RepID=A0A7J6G433_CANSA|nr:hypothetical protein F8388_025690 [Cannabis sativa]
MARVLLNNNNNNNNSRDSLVVGRVIGDVLDPFTRSVPMRVYYGNREVNNGYEFKPSQLLNQPRVHIGGQDLRTFYTLVTNLSITKCVYTIIIMLVIDIPGSTGPSFGEEVVCYENPRPSMGIHRFVFVLFKQLGRQTVISYLCHVM